MRYVPVVDLHPWGPVLLALLLHACSEEPSGTGEFTMGFAFVEGTVTNGQGEAVARANLTINILQPGCSGSPLTTSGALAFVIQLDGTYRVLTQMPASGPQGSMGCVEILVQPFSSTGLLDASASVDGVMFAPTVNAAPTVQIDVVVQ